MRYKEADEAEQVAAQVLVTSLYRDHGLVSQDMIFPEHWHTFVGLDDDGTVVSTVSLVVAPPLPMDLVFRDAMKFLKLLCGPVQQLTCFGSESPQHIVGVLACALQYAEGMGSHVAFACNPADFKFYHNCAGAFRFGEPEKYPYAGGALAMPCCIDIAAAKLHRNFNRFMRRLDDGTND